MVQTNLSTHYSKTLLQLVIEHAHTHPSDIAIKDDKVHFSYQELIHQSMKLAATLQAKGIGRHDKVAVLKNRDAEFLTCMLAIWFCGAIYIPLDPDYPEDRVTHIAQFCHLIVTNEVSWKWEKNAKLLFLDSLINDGNEFKPVSVHEDDVAYIIFTSGSTGTPKGAMVQHRGMLNHLDAKVLDLDLNASDVVAQTAPQTFDISIWQFLVALAAKGKTVVLNYNDFLQPLSLEKKILDEKITILEVVPSHLAVILAIVKNRDLTVWNSLKSLLVTGEAFPTSTGNLCFKLFHKVKIVNAYGPTECSDDVTHYTYTKELPEGTTVPIGKALLNIECYVLNDDLHPAAPGEKGELCIGGISVGAGYLNDSEKTNAAFITNPFPSHYPLLYKTGDIVSLDAEGNYTFYGRKDYQVKVNGFRIELGEIESVLTSNQKIKGAVVFVPKNKTNILVAALSLHSTEKLNENEIKTFLNSKLPNYMVPKKYILMEEMPVTTNGKIDRKSVITQLDK